MRRPDPAKDAHSGTGSRGPPVGSLGAATSRRVCPQAERRAGEEPRPLPPHRARPGSRPSPPRRAAAHLAAGPSGIRHPAQGSRPGARKAAGRCR